MLDVKLLGQFDVLHDGSNLNIPTRNAQSLFAYLVLHPGVAYRRERLASLLWPDSSEENARSNLRHELWRLRKTIQAGGESYILSDDLAISFNSESDYSLDVKILEEPPVEESTEEDLIRAATAYQGELLPGFYDEWVSLERERLDTVFEAKISRLLEILQAEGRWAKTLEWAKRWISFGQWSEPAYRALMMAYANTGNLSKAVATYDHFAQGLKKDLGIMPSDQTQALYKRLKSSSRLNIKRKTPPEEGRSPKIQVESGPPSYQLPKVRRSNLPKPLTTFIGREQELQEVEHLVNRARLVTITGSGGVGKTRLALKVADTMTPQYPDGSWWVELAFLSDPSPPQKWSAARYRDSRSPQVERGELKESDLVSQAVTKAMRIPENPDLPLLEGLVDHLDDKSLLLVLDNCEHLIEGCAGMVESVLDQCPNLTVLTTSREALGVPGEKVWHLPPLSLPSPDPNPGSHQIYQSEAVQLFVERTAEVIPGYQPDQADAPVIAQICHRLDGIPLAIELAAARMNLLSAQEIASRLDRRFSLLTSGHRTALQRHQTLRAAIEWSYDLLSEPEQWLFRRLSVFAGSFTLDAAEAISAGKEIRKDEVLTLLGRLVDKSLLMVEPASAKANLPTRYRFLDTILNFGRLKLDEAGETSRARNRHADYYVRLVETAEPELLLQNQVHWHQLLQAENDNLRAVVDWSVESSQAECALRLVGSLLWFWFRLGSNREGRDLALTALACPSSIQFPAARARALSTAGFLLCVLGETALARQSLEEAISILRETADKTNLSWALQFFALAMAFDQEFDLADEAFKEGLAINKARGDEYSNNFLFFLGDIELQKGDRTRAKNQYEESANILRSIGNTSFLAYPLRRLGYLALEEGNILSAWKYFYESLGLNHEIDDKPGITGSLVSMAALALQVNKPVLAAYLYGFVESRLETLSVNLLFTDQAELGRIRSELHTHLDEATFIAAFARGWELNEEEAIELVERELEVPQEGLEPPT